MGYSSTNSIGLIDWELSLIGTVDTSRDTDARQFMKPREYNGTTAIDIFIKQFDTCSRHNKWSSHEKCSFVQCALEDSANQVLWNIDARGELTYENLVDCLKQCFGDQGQV